MEQPQRLGRYRLEERLGMGGSAEVWRAVDEQLGRPVAVKLLHRHLVPDEVARDRLEREARAAAGLSHPGIVTVYDTLRTDDGAAIILELVEGETLAARLARQPALPPGEAARIAAEVAEALYEAHRQGVIHRDVKPGNILLDRGGRARLTDFGIARVIAEQQRRVTATGSIPGTLRYLAPEQLAGEDAGPRADVYALGVVLYEMLAGRPPFEAVTPLALAEAQRSAPPPIRGAPPALYRIAEAALQPDPDRRPRTAGAMASDLRAWESAPAVLPALAGATTVVSPPPPAAAVAEQPRRRRWLPLATLLAALGLLAALLVVLLVGNPLAPGVTAPDPTPTPLAATPTPAPEPTPMPDDLASAYAGFTDLVIGGQRDGSIEEGAAEDLLDRAAEVVKETNEGQPDAAADEIEELHEKIDEYLEEGRIRNPGLANRLHQAAQRLAAAAGV